MFNRLLLNYILQETIRVDEKTVYAVYAVAQAAVDRMVLFLKLFLMSLNVFYNQVFGQKGIDRTNDVSYGNIIEDRFQYLNERSITSTTVRNELDCAVLCIERPTCVSFQVKAAQAGSHGSRTCELLATDKFHSKQSLVHRSDYHYYTFYVSILLVVFEVKIE